MQGLNIQKQYEIAETLVGNLNKDLVHHCYLKLSQKNLGKIDYPNSYFYNVMKRELRKDSKFRESNSPKIRPMDKFVLKSISDEDYDYELAIDCLTSEGFNESQTVLHDLDPLIVVRILDQMILEGHKEEVQVFKYMTLNRGLEKKTGVRRDILKKICNFVRQTILERYVDNCH